VAGGQRKTLSVVDCHLPGRWRLSTVAKRHLRDSHRATQDRLNIGHDVDPDTRVPIAEILLCIGNELDNDGSELRLQAQQLQSWPDAERRVPKRLRHPHGRKQSKLSTANTSRSIRSRVPRQRSAWPWTRTVRLSPYAGIGGQLRPV
jgi:hypothetical protein